jgi:mono/diheme cytochrome c family protein
MLLQAQEAAPEGIDFFEKKIRPVLVQRCYSCHSRQAKEVKGELYLDSREGILKGGASGPAIVPGDPEKSRLIQAVARVSKELEMPPKETLSPEELADFVTWVRMGAPDPRAGDAPAPPPRKPSIDFARARQFWSVRPVTDPAPPAVDSESLVANAIDYVD